MPRKGRGSATTLSGRAGQPAVPPVNSVYGEGERALESQRRMPVPDMTGPGLAQAATNAPSGGAPTMDPRGRMAMAMALMGRMQAPQPLDAPTERPDQPLTAGLVQGPGVGPEVLRPGDRATRTLRMLADYADDPALTELADLAQRMAR